MLAQFGGTQAVVGGCILRRFILAQIDSQDGWRSAGIFCGSCPEACQIGGHSVYAQAVEAKAVDHRAAGHAELMIAVFGSRAGQSCPGRMVSMTMH